MVKKRFSHIEEHEMVTKINTDAMAKKKNTIVKKNTVHYYNNMTLAFHVYGGF